MPGSPQIQRASDPSEGEGNFDRGIGKIDRRNHVTNDEDDIDCREHERNGGAQKSPLRFNSRTSRNQEKGNAENREQTADRLNEPGISLRSGDEKKAAKMNNRPDARDKKEAPLHKRENP